MVKCFLLIAILASPLYSYAQKKTDDSKKSVKLNFEDELIEGSERNPDLILTRPAPHFAHKRLIHLRENFLSEMRNTAKTVNKK